MYIVNNLTSNLVNISDLRVQVGPRQILDLEKVTDRMSIERSVDLRQALEKKILRLVKHSVIKTNKEIKHTETVIEKIIEKPAAIDEEKLANLIRQVINETRVNEQPAQSVNSEANLKEFLSTIRQDIQNQFGGANTNNKHVNVEIDPAKLAELHQKGVEKMAESIEMSETKKPKSVKVVNKNSVTDLANEL